MAPLVLRQLLALLWKCGIMRKNHWLSTIFEITLPLVLSVLFTYMYTLIPPEFNGDSSNSTQVKDNWQPDQIFSYSKFNYTRNLPKRLCGFYMEKIYYAPNDTKINQIMELVGEMSVCSTKGFSSAEEVSQQLSFDISQKTLSAGIIFNVSASELKYQIRTIDNGMTEATNKLFPIKTAPGPTDNLPYENFGGGRNFINLQVIINEAYLNISLAGESRKIDYQKVRVFRYPYPSYLKPKNQFLVFQGFITTCVVLGYVVMCPLIVKRITDEKVAKAKEMLRMMGMSDWVFWGSHFLNYFSVMTLQNIIITICFSVGFGGAPLLNYSSGFLFFIVMEIYFAQAILFCMTITTIFNKPVIAVIVTIILWIASWTVPSNLIKPMDSVDNSNALTAAGFSTILPNMALNWCVALFGQFETYQRSLNFAHLFSSSAAFGSLTLGVLVIIMLASCFLYGILIWYIDAVWPWQFGVPKAVWFPFTLSYWFPGKSTDNKSDDFELDSIDQPHNNNDFEIEPQMDIGIMTKNLRKEFSTLGTNKKLAVDRFSLNIYQGQVTVLLGHNGAGKTTTMNMITGIYPPTRGTAYINSYDIRTQTRRARTSMSLCPQENIILNELTVEQHLKLYAAMKGFPWKYMAHEVQKTLEILRLTDKKYALATSLSGGMKRKLMLGIALIGDTKILVLDEPTSGMDPEARRAVWDLLQAIRHEKTILLTTHYMEEADVLGDRIAIMSEGVVMCCGSPMFLKKRFGTGYHLRIAKGENYNPSMVEAIIKRHIETAEKKTEIQSEVIFSLNKDSLQVETAKFPILFEDLEMHKEKCGVASYGLSVTTMDDVFLKVGNQVDEEANQNGDKIKSQERFENGFLENLLNDNDKLGGIELTLQRIFGLLVKRFHFARRYWPMIVLQIVLPALLFVLAMWVNNSIRSYKEPQPEELVLDLETLYGKTNGFVKSQDLAYQNLENSYINVTKESGLSLENLDKSEGDFMKTINNWALKKAGNLNNYIQRYLAGFAIRKTEKSLEVNPWFNAEATHAFPIAINLMYEAIFRLELGDPNMKITVSNYPMKEKQAANGFGDFYLILSGWIFCCLILVPMTVPFIGASYSLFVIHEQSSKSKLLQIMTGMSSLTFWLTNFLFDMFNHFLAMILIFLVILSMDSQKVFFGQTNTAVGLFLMLFLFGFASIPLAYCFSFWLQKPSSGFAFLVILYLLGGTIFNVAMSVCDYLLTEWSVTAINKTLYYLFLNLFRFLPVFPMSFGIQRLYRVGSYAQTCRTIKKDATVYQMLCMSEGGDIFKFMKQGCCPQCVDAGTCFDGKNPLTFAEFGIATEFIFMVVDGFLFIFIIWLLEGNIQKLIYRFKQSQQVRATFGLTATQVGLIGPPEDSDVVEERNRITDICERGLFSEEAIAVLDMTKYFNCLTAVDHITFGVRKEECFGLLGVNGAGKTTTFKMLTGDLMMTEGNAFIDHIGLCNDLQNFQKKIGYCPQFDALLDRLTGREMLILFARLRGVPPHKIFLSVDQLIKMVDLQKHADRCTQTYSGGNKRKLSLALAIIGNPPVVFLDEPTAGVDPAARRKIWSTLVYIQEKFHCSIILTSHSMEECEALCSRIAIMVNGQFKCLGSTQHLRSKFGQGYTVLIKLKQEFLSDPDYVNQVHQYITSALPSSVLKDHHQCLMHYHITNRNFGWANLFKIMENTKTQLQLEDYCVSDTTLEQIFLMFARRQHQSE